jgi:hypothetical protein
MKASAAKLVGQALVLIGMIGVGGCEYESAGVAAGLTAHSLSQVRRGMAKDEVLRVLGPPLSEHTGSSGYARLVYARSRSLSMGAYWMFQPGRECTVLLENDVVSEAYFTDNDAGVRCFCRRDACAEGWASDCLRSLR